MLCVARCVLHVVCGSESEWSQHEYVRQANISRYDSHKPRHLLGYIGYIDQVYILVHHGATTQISKSHGTDVHVSRQTPGGNGTEKYVCSQPSRNHTQISRGYSTDMDAVTKNDKCIYTNTKRARHRYVCVYSQTPRTHSINIIAQTSDIKGQTSDIKGQTSRGHSTEMYECRQ